MDPEKKAVWTNIFPTKYVIPKSLSRLAIGQVSFQKVGACGACDFWGREASPKISKNRWGLTTIWIEWKPNHRWHVSAKRIYIYMLAPPPGPTF